VPDPTLARDLRIAVGSLARRLRQLHAAGGEDDALSFIELGILARLARDGASTTTRLAAGERVTSQAVTAALRELVPHGLVQRVPDPDDGRRKVLTLTDAGRAVIAGREERMSSRLREVVDGLDPAGRECLAAAIPLLERMADEL
jgi:DNA-binding MarR family transcriptional regulator